MSLSPTDAWAQLNDALTRMTALNNVMREGGGEDDATLLSQFDRQADRAIEAHAVLILAPDVMSEIEVALICGPVSGP